LRDTSDRVSGSLEEDTKVYKPQEPLQESDSKKERAKKPKGKTPVEEEAETLLPTEKKNVKGVLPVEDAHIYGKPDYMTSPEDVFKETGTFEAPGTEKIRVPSREGAPLAFTGQVLRDTPDRVPGSLEEDTKAYKPQEPLQESDSKRERAKKPRGKTPAEEEAETQLPTEKKDLKAILPVEEAHNSGKPDYVTTPEDVFKETGTFEAPGIEKARTPSREETPGV
ncbi:unnamed protein product, partial [Ixodes persulcatus]